MNPSLDLVKRIKESMVNKPPKSIGKKPTLWPSQASVKSGNKVYGKCLRAAFWEKTGERKTNPTDEAVNLMGYMGNQIENGLIDTMKNLGLWYSNSVKFTHEMISGEIDCILKIPELSQVEPFLVNVECKTCTGYYVNKEVYGYYSGRGAAKTFVPGTPKVSHLFQAAIYADATNNILHKNGTILIYFSRDESKMTQFHVTVDEEKNIYIDQFLDDRFTLNDIYSRYRELQQAIETNTLPPADYRHTYADHEVTSLFNQGKISKTVYEKHTTDKEKYADDECWYCPFLIKCKGMREGTQTTVLVRPESSLYGSL